MHAEENSYIVILAGPGLLAERRNASAPSPALAVTSALAAHGGVDWNYAYVTTVYPYDLSLWEFGLTPPQTKWKVEKR